MMQTKHKGILKHAAHEEKKSAQLKWDEETIASQEKERGGKMKITEPKTPYNDYNSVLHAFCTRVP